MAVAPITVCIGTFGDERKWASLAQRAMTSVVHQTLPPENAVWRHGPDLQSARNQAASEARSEWLCFLDADDELDASYLEGMTQAINELDLADALLQPATLGVHPDGHEDPFPVLIPPKPLLDGNFLVIGTLVRRAQFERLGGFCDYPLYEDWDLWLRCWLDGATIHRVPSAIYRVFVNEMGRNSPDRATQIRVYQQIRNKHLVR